ncbi:hypothetical protein F4801DRAFT_548909 [Xylaria longipes]|nr:hypothetical protein F4801DRAFT_548909 [Xylaria longipes]
MHKLALVPKQGRWVCMSWTMGVGRSYATTTITWNFRPCKTCGQRFALAILSAIFIRQPLPRTVVIVDASSAAHK